MEAQGTFEALVLDHVSDAVIAIDNEGCITYFNPAAEHLYGISKAQALGRPLQDVYAYRWVRPEDEISAASALERAGSWRGENIHVRADGVTLWVESVVSVLKHKAGIPTGLLAVIRDISQRKRAEAALRASEERFRTALEIDTVGVIFFRPEGSITDANVAFQRMSQYSHDDFVQGHVRWDVMTPEEFMPASLQAVEELLTTGKTSPYAKQYIRKDGTRFWGLFAAKLLRDGEAVEFILDISDRKQSEAALRESEARFRTLADAVPQVIWTNDAEGRANYFNGRWYDYSGLNYEESVGLGWQALVHPDDAPASVEHWHRALAAGEMFDTEYRLRRADATYRWHLGRNVPLRDEYGHVTGWFGSATDIEDLKQAEASVRESEERFRLLVEGARDYAMFLLNPNNCITFWSVGAERLFGYTEDEAVGQSGGIIFTPEDREQGAVEHELQVALVEGRAEDRRWHVRKDGSRLFVDGVQLRLDDEHGQLRGFVKVGRDVTALREAEEALQRAHDALEVRVVERTAELHQLSRERQNLLERLLTAQEDERQRVARELHDSLGQFLSALTIRLTTVGNTSSIPATVQRDLESLRALARQIDAELDRLTMELRPPSLDDVGLLDALASYTQEWSTTSGIEVDILPLNMEQTRLPPHVETTVYRIVQEALTNVLKHAEASQVSLIVERRDEVLRVIIEDNGQGFETEALSGEGTGGHQVGLSSMRERARLIGGSLSVDSEPGSGTTMYLEVPLHGDTMTATLTARE